MRRDRNGPPTEGVRALRFLPVVALTFLAEHVRPRRRKALLAGVMVWSLVVAPTAVVLEGRGGAWPAIPLIVGIAGLVPTFVIAADGWDEDLRESLAAVPLFTAAVLLVLGAFVTPWALHDTVGHSARARVMEVWSTPLEGTDEEDPDRLSYRVADAVTEQDLGVLLWGLPERTPVGTVVEVSVVPGGWSPPVSTEWLDDGTVQLFVTIFRDVAAAHVLACAVAWFGWPRKDAR